MVSNFESLKKISYDILSHSDLNKAEVDLLEILSKARSKYTVLTKNLDRLTRHCPSLSAPNEFLLKTDELTLI